MDKDGKPTGGHITKVRFNSIGKDNQPVVLDLTVDEAVKKMSETPEFLNLFRSEGTGGFGDRNNSNGPKLSSLAEAAKAGPEAYRAARLARKL